MTDNYSPNVAPELVDNFVDISSEQHRAYHFVKEGKEVTVHIKSPEWLSVTDSGHRVIDANGTSYYIPTGWYLLRFVPREGELNFVK